MKKKLYIYIPLAVLAFLIITNPSLNNFKQSVRPVMSEYGVNLTNKFAFRKANYFIFSKYEDADDATYVGVAGNFFKIKTDTTEDGLPILKK